MGFDWKKIFSICSTVSQLIDFTHRYSGCHRCRAQQFFLSHCVGNASGTNESIQLTERRHTSTMSTHARQTSFGAMTNSNPTDANRSSAIQNQNVPVTGSSNDTVLNSHLGGNGQKKSLSTEHSSASNVKRVSDSQMTIPVNGEEIRRRSSASTDYNSGDRPIRKVSTTINPNTLTTIQNTKESNSSVHQQSTKSTTSYTNNGSSNEKVVLIDTTAVSIQSSNSSTEEDEILAFAIEIFELMS